MKQEVPKDAIGVYNEVRQPGVKMSAKEAFLLRPPNNIVTLIKS